LVLKILGPFVPGRNDDDVLIVPPSGAPEPTVIDISRFAADPHPLDASGVDSRIVRGIVDRNPSGLAAFAAMEGRQRIDPLGNLVQPDEAGIR